MMKLYHGSNTDIEKIDLSKSKRGKDFGCGFYLNPDMQQAADMAKRVTEQRHTGQAIVNVFTLDESELLSGPLKVKRFTDYDKEWLEFILLNRRNKTEVQAHDYDVVIGPIANDTVGVSIALYTDGYASAEDTINRLRFQGSRAMQYFFATERAVALLNKVKQ